MMAALCVSTAIESCTGLGAAAAELEDGPSSCGPFRPG